MEARAKFTPEGLEVAVTNAKDGISMTVKYSRMPDPWVSKKRKLLLAKKL